MVTTGRVTVAVMVDSVEVLFGDVECLVGVLWIQVGVRERVWWRWLVDDVVDADDDVGARVGRRGWDGVL